MTTTYQIQILGVVTTEDEAADDARRRIHAAINDALKAEGYQGYLSIRAVSQDGRGMLNWHN